MTTLIELLILALDVGMVSNDSNINSTSLRLRAIATPETDTFISTPVALQPRECAQTLSFCTSVDSATKRMASMVNKGFDLTALAGTDGKLVSAFSKSETPSPLSIIETSDADPGISHLYRLSSNTLQHVAHNGHKWLFAYLDEKKQESQTIIKCQTLEALLAQIKSNWKRGYRITSVAFGCGHWVAVATHTFDADEQSYFTATDSESLQEKTKSAWDEGKRIAAITYGADKWLVIVNKTHEIASQKWLTRKNFVDLRQKIREEWLRGYQVSSLARGADVWLVVLSKTE